MRTLRPGADLPALTELWRASLEPDWPVLPDGLELLHAGHVAEQDARIVGAVATDPLGSITFVAVAPSHRRRGIGSQLVATALADFRRSGPTTVTAGSGGSRYIWPGVPTNRGDAVGFFDALGWDEDYVATDLVQDLRTLNRSLLIANVDSSPDVEIGLVDERDLGRVLAFEDTHFPEWSRAFRDTRNEILAAREAATGTILGSLLLRGPGKVSTYWPLLGEDCATIGCVGVSPDHEGRGIGSAMVAGASDLLADRGAGICHIDWVVRVAFYARLGYEPWRDYSMRSLRLDQDSG